MLAYPSFLHPVAFRVFGLQVRWYGIMYLLGFLVGRQFMRYLCRKHFLRMRQEAVDDLLVALFFGMLLGARLLYMFVYYAPATGESWHWYTPFQIWKGGLSFHGAAIGMFLAMWMFGRWQKVRLMNLADSLALCVGPGIFLGRIGNFINAELYGRVTDFRWAMSFPVRDPQSMQIIGYTLPRHPSQLYEAAGEGLLGLWFIWFMKRYVARWQGELFGWGIFYYGCIRFLIEYVREADEQLGYFGGFTMGQMLCALMILLGAGLVAVAYGRRVPINEPAPGGHDDNPEGLDVTGVMVQPNELVPAEQPKSEEH